MFPVGLTAPYWLLLPTNRLLFLNADDQPKVKYTSEDCMWTDRFVCATDTSPATWNLVCIDACLKIPNFCFAFRFVVRAMCMLYVYVCKSKKCVVFLWKLRMQHEEWDALRCTSVYVYACKMSGVNWSRSFHIGSRSVSFHPYFSVLVFVPIVVFVMLFFRTRIGCNAQSRCKNTKQKENLKKRGGQFIWCFSFFYRFVSFSHFTLLFRQLNLFLWTI